MLGQSLVAISRKNMMPVILPALNEERAIGSVVEEIESGR